MAQTVEQLAKTVGASADRLLSQMKDAGLPHAAADEVVSEEDKQTLLASLKRSHGESTAAPKKITLKRKQVSTLKTGSGSAGKRTVNVEVRKKRTYVKREEAEEVSADSAIEESAVESAEVPAVGGAEPSASNVTDAGTDSFVEVDEEIDTNDPEVLRQRAAARRKAEDENR